MPKKKQSTKKIVVTGDVTIDWNIIRTPGSGGVNKVWTSKDTTRACWQRGAAGLVDDLIAELMRQAKRNLEYDYRVVGVGNLGSRISPLDGKYHHSYAHWTLQGSSTGSEPEKAWRVADFAGLDASEYSDSMSKVLPSDDLVDADIIVIDDANLGFRDNQSLWKNLSKRRGQDPWIVLKTTSPISENELLDFLLNQYHHRLVVVMNVEHLRHMDIQISRGLSWERTAQDLAWELTHNPSVNKLSGCAHLFVSFDTTGIAVFSKVGAKLVFDPYSFEGSWANNYSGGMIGNASCLTASIVYQLLMNPKDPRMCLGAQQGMNATRQLLQSGYELVPGSATNSRLRFPYRQIVKDILSDNDLPTVTAIKHPTERSDAGNQLNRGSAWTILENTTKNTIDDLAKQIVLYGIKDSLKKAPLAKYGNLVTIDRQEIESYRSIGALIGEYCRKSPQKRPLSIAVFGTPGSGKSFGVSEIAKSLSKEIKKLEFNLSQYDDPLALQDAFHQVRDVALKGKIPLVFFDEFDSTLDGYPYGWLRHFLAPMQDGAFQQGQVSHPIGKAIFVFAGGTSSTMDAFGGENLEGFKAVKGPDFVSRLKGFINVLGPNPIDGDSARDPFFVLRRAILMRSMFERFAGHLIQRRTLAIDPGVLQALLNTREYKHGARSMETILDISQLAGKNRFARSSLPPEAQLNSHVDGLEFRSLVERINLTQDILERLAEAAHDIYCENRFSDGWWPGRERDDKNMIHNWLIPYPDLPDIAKDANRVSVKTIPQKLAKVGYVMIPARGNRREFSLSDSEIEILAEYEHELWMEAKLAAGFVKGKPTKSHPNRNEYLVHWDELSKNIKQIDRDLVSGIPDILDRAGFTARNLNS
ncbi:MAG: RyR domain-containing protein [Candidatus Thorarchaeota archaeon]